MIGTNFNHPRYGMIICSGHAGFMYVNYLFATL